MLLLIGGLAGLVMRLPAVALAKGYATDDKDLKPGMVVALSQTGSPEEPKVERASPEVDNSIIGVTTTPDSELVTIASGQQQAYVQATGEVDAFVSDLNGSVEAGDELAISPLRGILMKADSRTATVIGIAIEGFAGKSVQTRSIDENGQRQEVRMATLRINLDHKAASNQQGLDGDSSLERLGHAITGENVGEIRVVAALIIFLIVLVAEGGIIYGAASSAITALGRNPMARKVILREMVKVIGVAITVLVLGLLAIYAILWI